LSWARVAGTGKDTKDVLLARQMGWDDRVYDSDGYTLKHAVLPEDVYTGRQIVFEQVEDRAEYQVKTRYRLSVTDSERAAMRVVLTA